MVEGILEEKNNSLRNYSLLSSSTDFNGMEIFFSKVLFSIGTVTFFPRRIKKNISS